MTQHKTTIHGKCPLNGSWDYYDVTITTEEFIKCEDIESIMNDVRGSELTQEDMAHELRMRLPKHCHLAVAGRHGQNIATCVLL